MTMTDTASPEPDLARAVDSETGQVVYVTPALTLADR